MRRGRPELKDLVALSKGSYQLAWPKVHPIHRLLARLFGEHRCAARCARPFASISHSSRGASSTLDPRFLAGTVRGTVS
jgi:hypothetical protein